MRNITDTIIFRARAEIKGFILSQIRLLFVAINGFQPNDEEGYNLDLRPGTFKYTITTDDCEGNEYEVPCKLTSISVTEDDVVLVTEKDEEMTWEYLSTDDLKGLADYLANEYNRRKNTMK